MNNLTDAHWFPLTSQGNIYSMTKLCSNSGYNKVLVASLKRKIYSCEYHLMPNLHLKPLVKELLFTYIPSGTEIISIDAYNKSDGGDGFVIGITILKASTDTSVERYLNIYTEGAIDGEGDEGSSIEAIAQNCLTVELPYTPYHLYHTILPQQNSHSEVVWLLSGSDYKIHMIREDKLNHGYSESSIEKYFPELHDIQGIAIWINIYYYDNYNWRLTVIGCECGLVIVAIVNVLELKVCKAWKLRYDRPISSVCIFPQQNNVTKPSFLNSRGPKCSLSNETKLNVLIVNTSNAVVFMDILNNGMDEDITLNGSETSDCILCSCTADINMDGRNEILLGTYGQEVLIFCFINNTWELIIRKLFDAPVHSICYMDITNDGMKELIVLTQRGVHILQHNIMDVKDKWKKRYRKMLKDNRT
ncbi:KICSTOR complex protein kaptin isoform X3 [Osmia lignaria lignaria]|nr:KICSTOR complex protein kaptin-like isoform X3 [Osmia lignaria]XP_034182990.1 KICSTOR complex protein kaptin-like isoform X3 [Osmia lignaria]XP_034182991.1 KICSTOR complex protein kaptin-like isoform X3 [Osmia lignaria]XP_034182992.1 KICSTOR complex protein kaptin-like isoform X3 [Osmia lignaria]XP_034182993.1 KICSTOR complex protein kaptin-like isoform X3 [Osmia lignaria]